MLFSKANLAVRDVATKDKVNRVLNAVHFSGDGSTVATDGSMLLAVGPVDESRVHYPDVGLQTAPSADGVTVPLEIVNQAVRNIPKDKRVSLQHVAMTKCEKGSGGKVEFTTTDQKKEQRVAGVILRDRYPQWKRLVCNTKDSATVGRVCVSRKGLIRLLVAMDNACPDDTEESPVFISFGGETDGLVLRSANPATGQHALGMIMPLDAAGQWMKSDSWERETFAVEAKKKIGKKKRRV